MGPLKTYLLAPDFTYLPGGSIALGNIIADPLSPSRVLSFANPGNDRIPLPEIKTVPDSSCEGSEHYRLARNLGAWAGSSGILGELKMHRNKYGVFRWTADFVETQLFKFDLTEKDIEQR